MKSLVVACLLGVSAVALCAPAEVRPGTPAPLILSGPQSSGDPAESVSRARISPWTPLFRGVDYCEGSTSKPKLLQVRALRVDLQEPDVDFLVTPSNGEAPKEVNSRRTSDFLTEFKCQVAINGSVFDVFARSNGQPMDVQGLSLSRGEQYSPANEWDALLIGTNRQAWIARSPVDTAGAHNGLSGFFASLYHGTNYGVMEARHPRTVVGVSKDGRYLFLMVMDGRQPGYSLGATTAEAAEWMFRLGAYDALNLDGGPGTTLVIEDTDGKPKLLNRPCGPPLGEEKPVANHLGVFAARLDRDSARK